MAYDHEAWGLRLHKKTGTADADIIGVTLNLSIDVERTGIVFSM